MAERTDPAVVTAIEQAIRDAKGTATCRGIARAFDVSPGTVRNIAKRAGLDGAFERTKTKAATAARQVDMAARRAALAADALAKAERMLARITESSVVLVATRDDVFRETLSEPQPADVKHLAGAFGLLADRHMALVKFDTKDTGDAAATSLADALATMLHLDPGTGPDYDDGYPAPPGTAGGGS